MDNYCTIYSHELCFDSIISEVNKIFPDAKITQTEEDGLKIISGTIKGGFLKSNKEFKISYRERLKPSYQITEMDSDLTQNLAGMSGFVQSLPTSHEKVKGLLIQKIQTINSEFAVLWQGNLTDELKAFCTTICQATNAIVFVAPGRNISQSTEQHFLDKNLDLILDPKGNCRIEDLDVQINSSYFDSNQDEVTADQKARKAKNEEIITARGIKLNKHLPCVESEAEVTIRSVKEIAERVTILALTNMVAFNHIEGGQALEYLEKNGIQDWATPKEMAFLNDPTDQSKSNETWKCECIWVFMWTLNIIDDLGFPDTLADLNQVPIEKYPIGEGRDPKDFASGNYKLRTKAEILDANDLYYRFDWACVDDRVKGQEQTIIHPGVVYERHYALNWLINYSGQAWDEVSCDT